MLISLFTVYFGRWSKWVGYIEPLVFPLFAFGGIGETRLWQALPRAPTWPERNEFRRAGQTPEPTPSVHTRVTSIFFGHVVGPNGTLAQKGRK